MKTVTQMAALTGISVRTLRYYDTIGLLKPTGLTEGGYRLYDEEALEKLYLILIYRELGFPLKEIGGILQSDDYDRNRILERQIALLEQKKTHLQNLIHFAAGLHMIGVRYLDFENFKIGELDDYSAQAQTLYGETDAYRESQEKAKGRTKEQEAEGRENALGRRSGRCKVAIQRWFGVQDGRRFPRKGHIPVRNNGYPGAGKGR